MASPPTLEQVEQLAQQLPPREQEALAQRLIEQLQTSAQHSAPAQSVSKQEYAAQIDAFLTAADALADSLKVETDSVETLRQCREERMQRMDPR